MSMGGIDCQDAAPMHRPSGYQKLHLILDVIFMHTCVGLMNYDADTAD